MLKYFQVVQIHLIMPIFWHTFETIKNYFTNLHIIKNLNHKKTIIPTPTFNI